jgi:putative tryptophan/tyrosine transport system substrate-binding protein
MTGGSDPVEAGLVESLARPGGNVTGLTYLSTELGGKRLELLKEALAKLTHVAVLYDAATPGTAREVKEDLPVAARALGLMVGLGRYGTRSDSSEHSIHLTRSARMESTCSQARPNVGYL